ncbi:MAG TPA: PA14 domain-containing protein, partial [Polyangiaceae bacterium]
MSKLTLLWVAAVLCASLIGCGNSPDHAAGIDPGDAGTVKPIPTGNACDTPNEGCACAMPGEQVDCGRVERTSGSYVSCSMGQRTCTDGKWGACIGDRVATLNLATGLQRTQALGTGMTCMDNPCDPYCRVVVDDPNGLPLPDGGALINDGGLQVLPHEDTGGGGLCTSMTVAPTPQALTVTGFAGTGLLGEYFNQIDRAASQIPAAWVPNGTRVDPNIDFDWDIGTPGVGTVGSDNFSVRWTGKISAPATDSYTLCASTDDGERVWLDNVLVINGWYDHSLAEICSNPINLVAGVNHDLRFEYYEAAGGAAARLAWYTPTLPAQVVPASAFQGPSGAQTLTVTGSGKFNVTLNPAGCYPGTPQPAWTLDRLDLATIDSTGQVKLSSAVAGPINVTAYLGQLSATGMVNVVVNIANTDSAPAGSVTAFQTAVTGTDPAKVLYPYDQTVLPIGLRAPLIQWDNGGTAATAVKITLQYPASGTATFTWSEIVPESATPQATVPRDVWKFFEQTAKGQAGTITLQRLIGGQPRPAITRTVNFSSTPIRGKIYYTQYHRGADANEMQADPGSENPAQPAFGSTDGCPVC